MRWTILLISAFLCTSLGGAAAMAAPVTLPLMVWCAYSSTHPLTGTFVVLIGGVTALETGWVLAYVLDAKELANPVGISAGALVAVGLGLIAFRRRPGR